ncbi:MAG: prenyltransferase/squalene oxidase repeat-containing protein [Verrucomicrobiota bacterium]
MIRLSSFTKNFSLGSVFAIIQMNRRDMLKTITTAGFSAAVLRGSMFSAFAAPSRVQSVIRYLKRLSRRDGGFAWEDQDSSHLTSTFAVIGCFQILQQPLPDAKRIAEFVRQHHPSRLKKLEQERRAFDFQQVQSLVWLGEDPSEFREKIRAWTKPLAYLKQYEQHGYPVFQSEVSLFACRALLGLPQDKLSPHFTDYLNSRRRENGSFNNTPNSDGGDGHVMNTCWGLQALNFLGRIDEKRNETVAWLRACQLNEGGFIFQPHPEFAGLDDVAYTWASVRSLKLLGAAPAHRDACVAYLLSLENADGGFADRPGWLSNPMATYRALDALQALDALEASVSNRKSKFKIRKTHASLPKNLKVFSIQLEAHGCGSPTEAVELARSLRIHLWGAKNAKPEWMARAQSIAGKQNVPVKFFVSNEEYGTWVNVPGLGTYSHTSDLIAPANADFGPPLSSQGAVSWPEFRRRRLAPLQKAGGHLIWQFGENEELARLYLDDSLQCGGYAAISTFHFGNPDFTNSEPFLNRYREQLPFVALQDAHGQEPWWFADMTTGFRTVFLATEPTWKGWLNALEKNWAVAIRHDAVSNFKTWMHGGSPEVLELVRANERDWKWWNNPLIQRPLVSIVAIRPDDALEVARPAEGVTLRIRCAWENTTQGLPKKPLVELVKLVVDGVEVSTKPVEQKKGGGLSDTFHHYHLPSLSPGKHSAVATARILQMKTTFSKTLHFN